MKENEKMGKKAHEDCVRLIMDPIKVESDSHSAIERSNGGRGRGRLKKVPLYKS